MGIPYALPHDHCHVHLSLLSPWRDAVDNYRGDDDIAFATAPVLAMPDAYAPGDTVIHVVHGREPAVLNVEELETGSDDELIEFVDSADATTMGLSLRAVERRLGERVPDAPATLDPTFARRLLDAINDEYAAPTPWQLTDTAGCLARVQNHAVPDDWSEPVCVCCGKSFGWVSLWDTTQALERHTIDREVGQPISIGPVVRVCAACHALLHAPFGPSVKELTYAWREECPHCEARTTAHLIWGMPPGPPPPGTHVMGCGIDPVRGTPDRECGECGYQWYSDPTDDNRPVWHREDNVSIDWRGGKDITITELMRDTLDIVRPILIGIASSGSTITYGELASSSGSRYIPTSMGRLLDVLSVDCRDRGEPSLASLVVSATIGASGSAFVGDDALARSACYWFWSD